MFLVVSWMVFVCSWCVVGCSWKFFICSGASKKVLECSKLSWMFLSHASMIFVLSTVVTRSELVRVTFLSIPCHSC